MIGETWACDKGRYGNNETLEKIYVHGTDATVRAFVQAWLVDATACLCVIATHFCKTKLRCKCKDLDVLCIFMVEFVL